ncbi:hypothetical protein OHA37_00395 [Streptomyces sp. NBC_00335]|uniref:hypothetical protein n=1 Tax=unclassified Streptomyces TaxID=2593676 RepID=UPI00225B182E|nr:MULTISPECIES: hypothetical protein [unclassified Streptomyces]MCX5410227.1 hypothetical protein [Streptomyces sp. NBC_00086]
MSAALDYPLSLAVEDFVPVLLTGAGAALLIGPLRTLRPRTGRTAAAGTALILLGGLSKAVWKLLVALDGPDVQAMNKALFPCLSFGFLLLAHALLTLPSNGPGDPARRTPPPLWGFAALWSATGAAGLALRSTAPHMVLTIVAVTVCGVRLILLARAHGDTAAAAAGGLWLTGMYVLGPLAARPDQSVALQWVEQSANTLTQGAFVLLAWRLEKRLRAASSLSSSPTSDRSAA